MDNLPITPITEVDWTFVNIWRCVTITMVVLFVVQMFSMLSHYWHWLMPLRRDLEHERGPGAVIAPPVAWTFAYHVAITVTMVVIGIGMAQSTLSNNEPTLFTFMGPVLMAAFMVIVNRFLKYYSKSLSDGLLDRSRWK